MKLDTLYKASKTGATQVINMEITGDTYTRTWGQVMGKQQSKATTALPKNVGRANETTGAEQAILEAQAVWAKKQKAGYSLDETAPTTVSLPMKVKVLQDQLKNINYPCISTPKLNGVNGTYTLTDDTLTLTSRGGEVFAPIPHLEDEIKATMELLGSNVINGELYIPGEFLQDITSAVKKPKELSKRLEFWIFDICDSKDIYDKRHDLMIDVELQTQENQYVKFLNGIECDDMDEIEVHYNQCMDAGLEGTVVKNMDGLYQYNVRSTSQFKYKKARDAEFYVEGYELDKNGHAVFRCTVDPEKNFKVKLKGTNEERLAMAASAGRYIAEYLKVEFEMLSKDGIPQKPVGIMFRKVDENGEAIE